MDPDQTAKGADLSGFTAFAHMVKMSSSASENMSESSKFPNPELEKIRI